MTDTNGDGEKVDGEAVGDGGDSADVDGTVHPFPGPRERAERVAYDQRELDEPIDLAAVQSDDELISALAAGTTPSARHTYHADDQVVALLTAWRADVVAEPIPDLVDLETAVAAVRAGARAGRRTRSAKGRHLAPVAAAAALLVLVGGGVSVGSTTAQPGSVLWPVSEVLQPERAASVQAAYRVSMNIESAKQALNEGKPDVASSDLAQAQTDLSVVRPQEGRAQLSDVQNFLQAKAAETPTGTSVDPASPLKTDRSRPIPAGAALAQQPTATGTVSPTATTDVPSEPSSRPSRPHPTSKTSAPSKSTLPSPTPITDSVGATAPADTATPSTSASPPPPPSPTATSVPEVVTPTTTTTPPDS